MAARNNIKWRKTDTQKVASVVRQFNAKLTRTLKAHPEYAAYLPERISTAQIRASSPTRQDLNRQLNSYKRFLRKGAEIPIMNDQGVQTTRWEKKEIGIQVGIINRRRTAERKAANVSTTKGTMGTIKERSLDPKPFRFNKMTNREWKAFKDVLEAQVKSTYTSEARKRYKENYLKAILSIYGEEIKPGVYNRTTFENLPQAAQELFVFIRDEVDEETLYQKFYDNPRLQLDFIYDPYEQDQVIEYITMAWRKELGK